MKKFRENLYGGIDVFEKDKFLLHLNNEDLMAIGEIQQRQGDLYTVRDRIPDWVVEQLEGDDFYFADFNSLLFSGDEISEEEIYQKLLDDDELLEEIAKAYRFDLDYVNGVDWWDALNSAIEKHVSIKDVMGEVLCDKRPKELEVGRWRIFVVEQGDLYGTDSHKVPWKDEEPCVEFYDLQGRVGQQWTTGRFYIRDLVCPRQPTFALSLDEMVTQGKGLELHPNRPDWVVKPGELNIVNMWLKAVYAKIQEKEQGKVENLISDAAQRYAGAEQRSAGDRLQVTGDREGIRE